MDLVTDYKKICSESTEKLIKYLERIYINTDAKENREFFSQIDKYYRALAIWKEALTNKSTNTERDKLLDNVLLDYCSMIHNVVIGDIKVLHFLMRNCIESFVRYITNCLRTKELEKLFSDASQKYSGNIQNLMRTYMSQLKQVYKESCLYVHADTSKIEKNICTLLMLENSVNGSQKDKIKADFTRINVAMICVLKIKYFTIFENMKENAKGYLDYVTPFDERIKEQI